MTLELPAWLTTLLVGGFLALVGYSLGLRRTKRERRWQATYEAYQRIFKALHDIHFWANETYASNLMLPSVGPAELSQLSHQFQEAKYELSSFLFVGELLISSRSQTAIDVIYSEISREEFRFEDDFGDESDYPQRLADHCDRIRKILDQRLPGLLQSARKDLG